MLFMQFLRPLNIFSKNNKILFKGYELSWLISDILSSSLSVVIVRDHLIEFIKSKFVIWLGLLANENAVHQLQKCVIVQILSNWSWDLLKLLESDHSCFFLVIKLPNSLKTISGSVFSNLCANHIDELLECEVLIGLSHGPEDFNDVGISLVETNLFKNFDNFLRVNDATSVFIKDKEDISQLFVVLGTDSVSPGCGNFLLDFNVGAFKVDGRGFDTGLWWGDFAVHMISTYDW